MTEPTFCDDWCLVMNGADCASGRTVRPAECVSDCELTRSGEDCFSLQERLLGCYDNNAEALTCVGSGFSTDLRVANGACQAERDALFECEAAGISDCLSVCRLVQAVQLAEQSAVDAGASPSLSGLGLPSELSTAALDSCPQLDVPCEDTCWTLFAFSSEGLEAAGFDPNAAAEPQGAPDAGDTSARSIADATSACVLDALTGCFPNGGPLAGEQAIVAAQNGADAGADEPVGIGEVINQCLFGQGGSEDGE